MTSALLSVVATAMLATEASQPAPAVAAVGEKETVYTFMISGFG